jgi:hypothetical protein
MDQTLHCSCFEPNLDRSHYKRCCKKSVSPRGLASITVFASYNQGQTIALGCAVTQRQL